MADADLDVVIRQTAKQQNKTLMAAVKARRDRYMGLAAKAKDSAGKDRFRQLAKDAMEQGTTAARRLQISADNTADSYARAMRMAAEVFAADTSVAQASAAKATAEKTPRPVKDVKARKPAKKTRKTGKA